MGALLNTVKDYFRNDKWEYDQSPDDDHIFFTGIEAENCDFDVILQVDEILHQITCFCIHPEAVPEDRRSDVAEYMIRANCNCVNGAYDMDFDEGLARVRASITIADMKPTEEMVEVLMYGVISMADFFYPGLLAVIEEESSPEEAIEEALMSQEEDDYQEEE